MSDFYNEDKSVIFEAKNPGFRLSYRRYNLDDGGFYIVPCIFKVLSSSKYEIVVENEDIDVLIAEFDSMKLNQDTASVSRETSRRRL